MAFNLYSSPLQGLTDFRFRNTFQHYFGGIDTFYAPYIRLNGKLDVKNKYRQDMLPENNKSVTIIPQILTSDIHEFLFVANYVKQLGYDELNWNVGCPYPMVAKRKLGSGLIKNIDKIKEILTQVYDQADINLSVKLRLGYDESSEILNLLPVLNKYPLKNITIHPRTGKQLYKGFPDLDAFSKCLLETDHQIIYNGDIKTVTDFFNLREKFPNIKNWMIGRWLIVDPFLPEMIKRETIQYPDNRFEIFAKFHDTLLHEYAQVLCGEKHLLMKMCEFWNYFKYSFSFPNKVYKKIKKAKSVSLYEIAVREIFRA